MLLDEKENSQEVVTEADRNLKKIKDLTQEKEIVFPVNESEDLQRHFSLH